ncbi:cytochrome P450 [Mycobacterium sp. 48b]|uniref:cytochrome P450 n=1 Tax=Mycobacterium sp. 48b TaxID=3400426 RepID=UPI003AAB32BC
MAKTDATPITSFDHHSVEFARDPVNTLATLTETAAVHWSTAHDGFWVLTRYEDVATGYRDFETFSSASGVALPRMPFGRNHIPVTLDPPLHTMHRHMLNPWFSKASIEQWEPDVRRIIRGFVENMRAQDEFDFVKDLSERVPGTVILTLLGFEPERQLTFLEAMRRGMENQGTTDPDMLAEIRRDAEWMHQQILAEAENRRTEPSEDLMTVLATGTLEDGHRYTDDELIDTTMLLLLAGFHTTNAGAAAIFAHLGRHHDQRQQLIENPSLIPGAVDELIRIYPPATGFARTVTKPVDLHGEQMDEGDSVLMLIAAANNDPRKYADPRQVDFSRNNSRTLTFGWGVHRCLGFHLARLMLRIEVEEVLGTFPGYEIIEDRVKTSDAMGTGYTHERVPARKTTHG